MLRSGCWGSAVSAATASGGVELLKGECGHYYDACIQSRQLRCQLPGAGGARMISCRRDRTSSRGTVPFATTMSTPRFGDWATASLNICSWSAQDVTSQPQNWASPGVSAARLRPASSFTSPMVTKMLSFQSVPSSRSQGNACSIPRLRQVPGVGSAEAKSSWNFEHIVVVRGIGQGAHLR